MTVRKGIPRLGKHCKEPDFGTKCPEVWGACQRRNTPLLSGPPQSHTMLHELVERIDVYHIQGTGKNRTQRLVIHYKFVGVLDLPHSPVLPGNVVLNSRQGVEIEYLVGKAG